MSATTATVMPKPRMVSTGTGLHMHLKDSQPTSNVEQLFCISLGNFYENPWVQAFSKWCVAPNAWWPFLRSPLQVGVLQEATAVTCFTPLCSQLVHRCLVGNFYFQCLSPLLQPRRL